MTTVVGIDPSLSCTGVARVTCGPLRLGNQWAADTWSRPSAGHRNDSLRHRHERVTHIVADVLSYVLPCQLAVVEEPAYGAPGGSIWDRASLWWRIVGRLLDNDVPVVLLNSSSRKKFATGRGGASVDKADVAMAAARMWPDVQIRGNDQADALVLASAGAVLLGLPVPFDTPGYRVDALTKVVRPEGLEAA